MTATLDRLYDSVRCYVMTQCGTLRRGRPGRGVAPAGGLGGTPSAAPRGLHLSYLPQRPAPTAVRGRGTRDVAPIRRQARLSGASCSIRVTPGDRL